MIRTGESFWVASAAGQERYPALAADGAQVDVAVIGGGIVGLTTALLLQRAGRSVALLEAARLGRQVTGGSTAKITSQHGLVYTELIDKYGQEAARAYAESNQAGLEWICREVREKSIDCDLERCPAYLYTTEEDRVGEIEREAIAAASLGLPAHLEPGLDLPVGARAALRFDAQAQFHPVRYLDALARELASLGGRIHENTRALDVERGDPVKVVAAAGCVHAGDVVVATHLPFLDRGGFFGRAFPYRHMCLAATIAADAFPPGMYISVDEPTRSTRTTPHGDGARVLIAAGESFPTGQEDSGALLENLETYVRERFGAADAHWRWGNQDYYSSDRLPWVGRILPGSSRIRVATGFSAWGITAGTIAAQILADDVLGRDNPWASLYDARRTGLRHGGGTILKKNATVAGSWIAERLRSGARQNAGTLRPGEGDLVRLDGRTVAAYRDADGHLHAVNPYCTHLGCELNWNAAELSWDCHCHGSRFDVEGGVLNGPAVRNLGRHEPPEEPAR